MLLLCTKSLNLADLCDPTPDEVKKKILSALRTLSHSGQQSVLVQFWAPTKSGRNSYLLTTTDQPYGFYGIGEGLKVYHKGYLHHKLYVHHGENVAFGLPSYAFMCETCVQTQDLHRCPADHRPPCEDAVFDQIWGAFALIVKLADKRVGVLNFVIDTPKDSYGNEIWEVCKALEYAGLQSSLIYIDHPRRNFVPPTRERTTQSSVYAHFDCLAPLMGLSKAEAMKTVVSNYQLQMPVKEGTFSNAHKSAGIPEWPWVRSRTTRPSAAPQTNPTASESSTTADSFGTPRSVLTSCWDGGISDMSWEQTAMTNNALETQNYEIPFDASFATRMTTDDGNPDLAWTGNVLENIMPDDSIFSGNEL
ncbi:hypothetical protein Tco_1397604 [Tanacetum coccineum]